LEKHASGPARRMEWVGSVLPLMEEKFTDFLIGSYFIELGADCRIILKWILNVRVGVH
jgi:hypothetical protein